jgi:hypothetical protein
MLARSRALLAIVATFALLACQEDGPQASGNFDGGGPDLLAAERTACEKTGGRWGLRAGDSLFVCYRNTPDAGKLCRSASDCDGLCLARSRTCTPFKPFLGCHEVLTEGGLPATLCLE